jgi:hypothetical protein
MLFLKDNNKKFLNIYLKNLPTFTSGAIRNIAYGNGKFVAIAGTSSPYQLLTSDDGINWSVSSFISATIPWNGLFFGNGMFIVSNGDGYPAIGYSYDGTNWNYGNGAFSVGTYGNGKFVGLQNGNTGEILRISTNGINFTQYPSSVLSAWFSNYNFRGIEYQYSPVNGHMFVAMGRNSGGNPVDTVRIAFSSDGENWQKIDTPVSSDWASIASGNGKFVIISSSQIIYSENGIAWSVASRPSGTSFLVARKIIFSNGKFYIFGSNAGSLPNYCLVSSDGINWSTLNLTNQYANWSLAATNNEAIVMLPQDVGSGGITQIIGSRSGRFQFIKTTTSKYKQDPYYENVSLLIDFENGIKDESKYNHTIQNISVPENPSNYVNLSSVDKKYGNNSAQLVRSSNNRGPYLYIENSTNFNFGNQDFTIELWINASAYEYLLAYFFFINNTYTNWMSFFNSNFYGRVAGEPGLITLDGPFTFNPNTWVHMAAVRNSNNLSIYKDGNVIASNANYTYTLQNTDAIIIGSANISGPGSPFDGYIDNIRITMGVARYTSNFTPEDFQKFKNKKINFLKN